MSYAIIRNANCKMNQIPLIERHNERLNHNYGNNDIDINRSHKNYHLKKIQASSYLKEFERIREKHNLKGNLRLTGKKQSNIMCEFIITSDKEFFEKLGEDGTRRFFEDAYEFVKQKVGGEEFVVAATVHNDEGNPHCHIIYVPVVNGKDRKGNPCKRINCSEFWRGRDSYSRLQDEYYNFITSCGYSLERGVKGSTAEHLSVAEYKLKKTEENLNKTAEKADEIKKNIAKDNEYSIALRRKARSEYAVATKTREELEIKKRELDSKNEFADNLIKSNKQTFLDNQIIAKKNREERARIEEAKFIIKNKIEKIEAEYKRLRQLAEQAQNLVASIKDTFRKQETQAQIDELVGNLGRNESVFDYADRISKNSTKSKERSL